MPEIDLIPFLDADGSVPLIDWLDSLPTSVQIKCTERLDHLAAHGHELRRPHVDYLRGTDLYELRVKVRRINYRILFFFHGREAAIVSHGFSKEDVIPPGQIALATDRMNRFKADPKRHSYRGPR